MVRCAGRYRRGLNGDETVDRQKSLDNCWVGWNIVCCGTERYQREAAVGQEKTILIPFRKKGLNLLRGNWLEGVMAGFPQDLPHAELILPYRNMQTRQ